jgi:hypothetical protein
MVNTLNSTNRTGAPLDPPMRTPAVTKDGPIPANAAHTAIGSSGSVPSDNAPIATKPLLPNVPPNFHTAAYTPYNANKALSASGTNVQGPRPGNGVIPSSSSLLGSSSSASYVRSLLSAIETRGDTRQQSLREVVLKGAEPRVSQPRRTATESISSTVPLAPTHPPVPPSTQHQQTVSVNTAPGERQWQPSTFQSLPLQSFASQYPFVHGRTAFGSSIPTTNAATATPGPSAAKRSELLGPPGSAPPPPITAPASAQRPVGLRSPQHADKTRLARDILRALRPNYDSTLKRRRSPSPIANQVRAATPKKHRTESPHTEGLDSITVPKSTSRNASVAPLPHLSAEDGPPTSSAASSSSGVLTSEPAPDVPVEAEGSQRKPLPLFMPSPSPSNDEHTVHYIDVDALPSPEPVSQESEKHEPLRTSPRAEIWVEIPPAPTWVHGWKEQQGEHC